MISDQFSAEKLAKTHYENFPVASFLLPRRLRRALYTIYAFARLADDIADHPTTPKEEKLDALNAFETELKLGSQSAVPLFQDLAAVIKTFNLTEGYFTDLLKAFRQDAENNSFATYDDLLTYSAYSANPVGRLMLELNGIRSEKLTALSDKICTALQLINFWQDLSEDKKMARFYIPTTLLEENGLSLNDFYFGSNKDVQNKLLDELIFKTEQLFVDGQELMLHLTGRIRLEVKLICSSARLVLQQIKSAKSDLLENRPALNRWDKLKILTTFFR
jgi:squalene synthase HpnC